MPENARPPSYGGGSVCDLGCRVGGAVCLALEIPNMPIPPGAHTGRGGSATVCMGGNRIVRQPHPRAGILMARGRGAADFPLTQTIGQNTSTEFKVWAVELA